MIPLSDDNPTLRTPITTYLLLGVTVATWLLFQGAGFDVVKLAASVCNLGLVPAELTHTRPVGFTVPLGPGLGCAIDDYAINTATPVT